MSLLILGISVRTLNGSEVSRTLVWEFLSGDWQSNSSETWETSRRYTAVARYASHPGKMCLFPMYPANVCRHCTRLSNSWDCMTRRHIPGARWWHVLGTGVVALLPPIRPATPSNSPTISHSKVALINL